MTEYELLKTLPQSEAIGSSRLIVQGADNVQMSNRRHRQFQTALIKPAEKTFSLTTLYLYGLSETRDLTQKI